MADQPASITSLAQALKAARERKGLTQRALAGKVGMPQSHISKIENGAVDFQASSLIELARVLDLEAVLVPKALLPALRSLTRTADTSHDRETQRSVLKAVDQVEEMARKRDDVHPGERLYAELLAALQDMRRLRLDAAAARRLKRFLTDIATELEKISDKPDLTDRQPQWSYLDEHVVDERIRSRIRDLRNLRNAVAHGAPEEDFERQPAYRLTDSDDDG